MPSREPGLTVAGELDFRVKGPEGEPIDDRYSADIRVAPKFPSCPPTVRGAGGRVPDGFHKLAGGALCLGAPTALRLGPRPTATLARFAEAFVGPYLFGHSYLSRYGVMPFGELEHGVEGLRQHFASLFRAPDRAGAEEFVRLASLKRRDANKQPCPCRGGRRLGRCHNRRVNGLRDRSGRPWLRHQYRLMADPE